jgi:hypothetical protein
MGISKEILRLADQLEAAKMDFDTEQELDEFLVYLFDFNGVAVSFPREVGRELAACRARAWSRARRRASWLASGAMMLICALLAFYSPLFPSAPIEGFFDLVVRLPLAVVLAWVIFLGGYRLLLRVILCFCFGQLTGGDPFLRFLDKREVLPPSSLLPREALTTFPWLFAGLSLWFLFPWIDGHFFGGAGVLWPALLLVPVFCAWAYHRANPRAD